MASTVSQVAGTDGIVPNYNPTGRWTTYALSELFMGAEGTGKYVPNVNDHVEDLDENVTYRVTAVDTTTWISTLAKVDDDVTVDELSDEDRLMGVGPGTQSDTYRAYIDQSVTPHTLALDARLRVAGSTCTKAKIFKGSVLDGTGVCISAFYDTQGNLLGENIPLELADTGTGNNKTIKVPSVCYTTQDLEDGDVLTVVFYSDDGGVVSKRQVLAENTGFIRTTDASKKYVTGISLETPFLSSADPTLIQYPLNVPLSGFSLYGVVHYSNGDKLRTGVDGTKFSISGMDTFVSTIIGQKVPLVLKYILSSDEIAYGVSVNDGKFLTEEYTAITTKADGAYTVKLYCYPEWVSSTSGYKLRWFMLNLDRNTFKDVTALVSHNENSSGFSPLDYGVNQGLSVSINLNDVNGVYKKYIHTQSIEVLLRRAGDDHTGTNWSIGFEPSQNPQFGVGNSATLTLVNQNLNKVVISQGETGQTAWLERMYYRSKPLYDSAKETQAPVPNMFSIIIDGVEYEYRLSQWADDLTFNSPISNSTTIYVKFFKRTADTDMILSVIGLPAWQTT